MLSRNHLRKVDEHGLGVIIIRRGDDENVKFIEISVNESDLSESDNEIHKLRIKAARIGELVNLTEGEGIDERHNDAMSSLVKRLRDGKSMFVKDLERESDNTRPISVNKREGQAKEDEKLNEKRD